MKFAIVPALSALLLAGVPAHADTFSQPELRVAQNGPDDGKPDKHGKPDKPAEVAPSPATVPAGTVDDGKGHKGGGGRASGGPAGGAAGGATGTGGGHGGGGAAAGGATGTGGGHGGGAAAGGSAGATGGPAQLGGPTTGAGTVPLQGGGTPAGGRNTGGRGTGAPAGAGGDHGGPAQTGGPATGGPASGGSTGVGGGHGGPATGGPAAGGSMGVGGGHGGPATGATTVPFPGGRDTGGRDSGGRNTGGADRGDHGGSIFGTRPQNWNQYPRTFDRGTYERNVTAPHRFHWQTYQRPRGWFARRWIFGQILPNIFWRDNYWLTDYWMFDLPVPPYGYVWVRYGDDALLVNKRTGRVLQVVYDLFD